MAKFKTISRYDRKIASEGVFISVRDEEFDIYAGRFKLKLCDTYSQRWNAAVADKGRQSRLKNMTEQESVTDTLLEFSLIGWEDIFDEDGKAVAFDVATAREFLNLEDHYWILLDLFNRSRDPANFQATSVPSNEVIAKN